MFNYFGKVGFELCKVNIARFLKVQHLEAEHIFVLLVTVADDIHDLRELCESQGTVPIDIKDLENTVG